MTLKDEIRKREGIPISFDQITKVIGPHRDLCKLIIYDESYKNITTEKLFGDKKICVLLVSLWEHSTRTNINHWVLLIRRGPHSFDFFDSLGNTLPQLFSRTHDPHEELLKWADQQKIHSSYKKFQKFAAQVETCGYHIACRIMNHGLSPKAYVDWFHGMGHNTDFMVALLCHFALKS